MHVRRAAYRVLRGALVALATILAAASCGSGSDRADPTAAGALIVKVWFNAQIAAVGTTTGPLSLQVGVLYERTSGPLVSLGTQTTVVTSGTMQQVPLSFDLTTCLADRAHLGAAASAGGNAVCLVHLTVTLLAGDRVLDTETLGPIPVSPGSTAIPAQSITLYEVARVVVAPVGGSAPPAGTAVRVALGQTLPLTAQVLAVDGQVVQGRTIAWTSDAPAVARVDSLTGVVTPVTLGTARVHASAGGRDGTIDVAVVPAPAPITVTGGGGTGNGRVRSSPAGLDCQITAGVAAGACTFTFPGDGSVTLTATPDSGAAFTTWGGDCAASAALATCPLVPSAARTVTASFARTRFVLTATGSGAGNGRLTTAGSTAGIDCQVRAGVASGTCTAVFSPQTVSLTATPDSASVLAAWTGDCATQSAAVPTCQIAMTQDRSVGAVFGRRQVTLTLTISGAAGQVTVNGTPACTLAAGVASVTCQTPVDVFGQVTLLALPAPTSFRKQWGGPCATVAIDQPCTFRPTADVAVPVIFLPAPVSVSVRPATGATGAGSVTIPELARVCQLTGSTFGPAGQCDAAVAVGSTLTFTARPSAGSVFVGWSGACAGQTGPACTLGVGAAITAIADFEPAPASSRARPAGAPYAKGPPTAGP